MKIGMLVLMGSLAASAALSGCGGDVSVENTGGGGSGGDGGQQTTSSGGGGGSSTSTSMSTSQGGSGGQTSTTTPSGTGGDAALAIHVLRIGDADPNGQPSTNAWKSYGANIDGKVSTKDSVDLCKPAAGAKASAVYADGDGGIDNGFGKNVLPILLSLSMDISSEVNAAIDKGGFSVVFRIDGIGAGQTGTFVSRAYTGGYAPASSPAWMGTDVWPVRSDSLQNGDFSTPKALYPTSQVTVDGSGQRVWSSQGSGEITLVLKLSGFDMSLPLRAARLSAVLSDDNTKATGGMISGVLDTEAFIDEIAKIAGSFDPSLCPPSATFESIAQQIRQAQDILLDGTQDTAKTCNGISIGLGFDAEGALLGSVFDPPTSPDPCNP